MSGSRLPVRAAAAAAVLLAAAGPALAQGCAMCRKNLEQNGGGGVIQGFFWSIVLLVSLPLLMTGTFALLFWRAGRKRAAEALESGDVVK